MKLTPSLSSSSSCNYDIPRGLYSCQFLFYRKYWERKELFRMTQILFFGTISIPKTLLNKKVFFFWELKSTTRQEWRPLRVDGHLERSFCIVSNKAAWSTQKSFTGDPRYMQLFYLRFLYIQITIGVGRVNYSLNLSSLLIGRFFIEIYSPISFFRSAYNKDNLFHQLRAPLR